MWAAGTDMSVFRSRAVQRERAAQHNTSWNILEDGRESCANHGSISSLRTAGKVAYVQALESLSRHSNMHV